MKILKTIAGALLALAAFGAQAGLPETLPQIVKNTVGNSGRVYDSYVVDKKTGMTAWTFSNKAVEYGVFYTVGDYAFYGQALKDGNENIAALDAMRYNPDSDVSAIIAALDLRGVVIDKSHKKGKKIFMILDPTCSHCRDFISKYEKMKKSGKLNGVSIVFLPVNLLGGQSSDLSVDFLTNEKSYQRMRALMTNSNTTYRLVNAPKTQNALETNTRILVQSGLITRTPSFILPRPHGGYWAHNGALDTDILLQMSR